VRVSAPSVRPYATYVLLAATILTYLMQVGTEALLGTDLPFQLGAKYGPLIRIGEVWRLITPVFLHGSFLHIAFNMYALVIYGRGLEARFGHGRFLLLYFLSAYAGNVLSFLLVPNPSLGASTAVFGLLAAEVIFLLQNRGLLGQRVNATLWNLLFIAGYNLVIGFSSQGVDNFGHIGGLLGGLLFTWFGGPRWKVEGLYPLLSLVDEREGHGALAGTAAVLLIFIPLAALGWFWAVK
jgi:rhomboid protease GluP